MDYIKLQDIPISLGIEKGDKIFVSSAVKSLVKICREHEENVDLNDLIDAFIDAVGEEGTVIFPTYNWDWCKGEAFDYKNTSSQVGALSQTALERSDFKRTKHPIYSFAVWGRDQELLCGMDNKSAFGHDSPFAYFLENHVTNIIINVEFKHSFTFVHFVEEQLMKNVPYRYMKNFRADYTDEFGNTDKRVYSMLVRSYWYEVIEEVDFFEDDFIKKGAQDNIYINGLKFAKIDFAKTYPIIKEDILSNMARKVCTHIGQGNSLSVGTLMYGMAKELYTLCSSITGEGLRNRLQIVKSYLSQLELFEIKSGTKVYDWEVPDEWNIEKAYIENEKGEKIVDFKKNNLHVVGYSAPIDMWVDLKELDKYVYVQEEQPDAIPYVTSYYETRSGFCMSKRQFDSLEEGKYHLVIKSDFKDNGSLSYGEAYFPGELKEEILISTYLCHPSMANNECSGPAVATFLAKYIAGLKHRRYSYRFIFVPETIGSIAWLSKNYENQNLKEKVIAGFVLSCVGDNREYSYVESKYANTLTDRLLQNVLSYHYPNYKKYSFLQRGSDERQFNAPGIDLPVCAVCRSKYGEYPEYHTSEDNLDLISEEGLEGAFILMKKCIQTLEYNYHYKVKCYCEPQLGKRGLYSTLSQKGSASSTRNMTNFLTYADGKNDLIKISDIIGVSTEELISIIDILMENDLLETVLNPV
ncbi:MAG: DUF4910 domain-containing protein [Lachnospiraceae bacterium]|nr:DUF4910 domain-containing protein [Lachnospiraceae bacterium]